jgi:hypothetical protein
VSSQRRSLPPSRLGPTHALVGLGAVLLPFALRDTRHVGEGRLWRVIGICWLIAGVVWLGFGALNYFTHIGLIHNTN